MQQLLRRVEVRPDPELSRRFPDQHSAPPARSVSATGATLEREQHDYEGFHTRPMGWDTVAAKFNRLAAAHIDSGTRTQIADAVRRLDELDHLGVSELMRAHDSTDIR